MGRSPNRKYRLAKTASVRWWRSSVMAMTGLVLAASPTFADDAEDLAKKLSNPVAALISVPFQYNYDQHYGDPETGHRSLLNIQPVVPISLNADWNVISRTIIPFIDQNNVVPGSHQTGVGDVLQSSSSLPRHLPPAA